MATAEDYAGWIVKHADKKGTPEFETVAKAYQVAKNGSAIPPSFKESIQRDPLKSAVMNQPPEPSMMSRAGRFVKEGALPAIGATGGAVLGGLATTPTVAGVPAGVLGGEAVGAGLGELANQKLGVKYKSVMDDSTDWGDVAWSAASPGVGRGIYAGGKQALNTAGRFFPGSGFALQEWGTKKAGEAMQLLKKRIPDSSKLYGSVEKLNPVIDTPKTMKTLQKLEQDMMNATKAEQSTGPFQAKLKYVQSLLDEMRGTAAPGLAPTQYQKPAMGFQKLHSELQHANRQFGSQDPDIRHLYGVLKGAIRSDIDAAAIRPTNQTAALASRTLKEANTAYRKELAYEELENVMKNAIGSGRSADMATSFNRGTILKALRDNEKITKNLTKDELADMTAQIKGLGYIPSLPPPIGTPQGAGRVVIEGAIGRLVGILTGGNPDLDMTAAMVTMEALSHLARTDAGKSLILKAANAQGSQEGAQALATISAMIAGGSQKPDIKELKSPWDLIGAGRP